MERLNLEYVNNKSVYFQMYDKEYSNSKELEICLYRGG